MQRNACTLRHLCPAHRGLQVGMREANRTLHPSQAPHHELEVCVRAGHSLQTSMRLRGLHGA
jgi:hypothetical protein